MVLNLKEGERIEKSRIVCLIFRNLWIEECWDENDD